jgi:hypothetical protein
VIRERIGQAALRAYPPAVRRARGPEMLGMLLDAGQQSNWALMRESGSLVLGGLRERRAITARGGTRRLIADSCCQAAIIVLMLWLFSAVNTQVITGPTHRLLFQEVVLAGILACALIGYERIAALSGLAALIAYGPVGQHVQLGQLATVLVPTACLLVMLRAPRRRPRDSRRLLWLLPLCLLAALQAHLPVGLPGTLAVVSVGGLVRLFHDPRLAIACSLVWIGVLSFHAGRPTLAGPGVFAILTAVAAGLMLTVAVQRLWIMRHSITT